MGRCSHYSLRLDGGSDSCWRFAWNRFGFVGDQPAEIRNQHKEANTNGESDESKLSEKFRITGVGDSGRSADRIRNHS